MAEYSRIIAAVHQQYSRKLARETEQKRLLVAMLKKFGRIRYKQGGGFYEWRVRFKEHPFQGVDDMEVLTWQREDTYKRPFLEWREVIVKDVISRREVKLNRGKEQILRIYDEKMEVLKHDFASGFSDNLWQDGNAAGRTKFFHGIESIMADDNATAPGAVFAAPADTYAGLSTTLGTYGNVQGDPGYGFFSPTLVNALAGGSTWAASADHLLRRAILATTFGNNYEQMVQAITCTQEAYRLFLDLMEGKERIIIEKGAKNDLTSMGFKAVEFEGIPITWQFGIPAAPASPVAKTLHCYGLNFYGMMLAFCGDQSEICEGNVYYDEDQRSYKFLVESLGNLFIREPRLHFKVADYA